ncbi:MAG: hypothetical protein ACK481_11375 [Candidatus Melainabacteria bacterium]|jgi:hypothetical protein
MSEEPKKLIWDNDLYSREPRPIRENNLRSNTKFSIPQSALQDLRIEEIFAELDKTLSSSSLDNKFTFIKERIENKHSCLKERYIRVPIKSNTHKKRKVRVERIFLSLLLIMNLFLLISQNQFATEFQDYSHQQMTILSDISRKLEKLLNRYSNGIDSQIDTQLKSKQITFIKNNLVKEVVNKKNSIMALISKTLNQNPSKNQSEENNKETSTDLNKTDYMNSYRLNHSKFNRKDLSLLKPHQFTIDNQELNPQAKQNSINDQFAIIKPVYQNSADIDEPEAIIPPKLIAKKSDNLVKPSQFIPTSMKKIARVKEENGNYSYNDLFGELIQEKQLYKGRKIKAAN